uniref:Uncharacterized protein n=1 Tax=Glossina palpalis gambiensis TaxID=67801 RepID=A0A1B0BRD5_9MUSC
MEHCFRFGGYLTELNKHTVDNITKKIKETLLETFLDKQQMNKFILRYITNGNSAGKILRNIHLRSETIDGYRRKIRNNGHNCITYVQYGDNSNNNDDYDDEYSNDDDDDDDGDDIAVDNKENHVQPPSASRYHKHHLNVGGVCPYCFEFYIYAAVLR